MPRKPMPWFRVYVEAVYDRKLRRQDPAIRWLWVAVLAIARQSPTPGALLLTSADDDGEPVEMADIADVAAIDLPTVEKGMAEFERLGMLERDGNAWLVARWADRQFESDDVTKRTRKHRSQEPGRNVPIPFQGTAPETETETEKKPFRANARTDDPPSKPATRATRLPKNWSANSAHRQLAREEGVNCNREVVKFRNHAEATGRKQKMWDAAFRNWLLKAGDDASRNSRGVPPTAQREPMLDEDGNPVPGVFKSETW